MANYMHLLNHQGITFKMMDKKALSTKVFITQIEVIIEMQIAHCAALVDPFYMCTHLQHQLVYEIEDADMLHDAIKLTFS
jgi:paired amphipathic helix protein Sin3a